MVNQFSRAVAFPLTIALLVVTASCGGGSGQPNNYPTTTSTVGVKPAVQVAGVLGSLSELEGILSTIFEVKNEVTATWLNGSNPKTGIPHIIGPRMILVWAHGIESQCDTGSSALPPVEFPGTGFCKLWYFNRIELPGGDWSPPPVPFAPPPIVASGLDLVFLACCHTQDGPVPHGEDDNHHAAERARRFFGARHYVGFIGKPNEFVGASALTHYISAMLAWDDEDKKTSKDFATTGFFSQEAHDAGLGAAQSVIGANAIQSSPL